MLMKLGLALASMANGVELTSANWDKETAGKVAFIKFLAPWCGHCKKMKPDWDKLMKKFKDHKTTVVADVDCTAAGQSLCETHGIRGYPSIKHGDPNGLEEYQSGRDYASLEKFAEGLKPLCSPVNIDLCDEEQTKSIKDLQALGEDELKTKIEGEEKKIADAEKTFKEEVEKLQKKYESLQKEKEDTVTGVKNAGLGLMKSVQASAGKSSDKADDDL